MSETTYEGMVIRLEHGWQSRIREMFSRVFHDPMGSVEEHEIREAVEDILLQHPEWQAVNACDISDIVGEAYERWEAEQ